MVSAGEIPILITEAVSRPMCRVSVIARQSPPRFIFEPHNQADHAPKPNPFLDCAKPI